jgi:hypothetical protein
MDQRRTLVNEVMNLWFYKKRGISLPVEPLSASPGKILFHGGN